MVFCEEIHLTLGDIHQGRLSRGTNTEPASYTLAVYKGIYCVEALYIGSCLSRTDSDSGRRHYADLGSVARVICPNSRPTFRDVAPAPWGETLALGLATRLSLRITGCRLRWDALVKHQQCSPQTSTEALKTLPGNFFLSETTSDQRTHEQTLLSDVFQHVMDTVSTQFGQHVKSWSQLPCSRAFLTSLS